MSTIASYCLLVVILACSYCLQQGFVIALVQVLVAASGQLRIRRNSGATYFLKIPSQQRTTYFTAHQRYRGNYLRKLLVASQQFDITTLSIVDHPTVNSVHSLPLGF